MGTLQHRGDPKWCPGLGFGFLRLLGYSAVPHRKPGQVCEEVLRRIPADSVPAA